MSSQLFWHEYSLWGPCRKPLLCIFLPLGFPTLWQSDSKAERTAGLFGFKSCFWCFIALHRMKIQKEHLSTLARCHRMWPHTEWHCSCSGGSDTASWVDGAAVGRGLWRLERNSSPGPILSLSCLSSPEAPETVGGQKGLRGETNPFSFLFFFSFFFLHFSFFFKYHEILGLLHGISMC